MTREFLITLAMAVGFRLSGKMAVYHFQKTKGSVVALICLLAFAGFWAALGVMLTMIGVGGLVMAPLFPGKVFAFFILIPGLWLLAVFFTILLRMVFNQQGSAINQFLLHIIKALFNPTSMLPNVQQNSNFFKVSSTEQYRLEIPPFWQLTALGVLIIFCLLGEGLLVCWIDYVSHSAQGIGLLASALLLPATGMGLQRLWKILRGEYSLIIKEDGLVIPNSRKMYLWGEIQEFKVVNYNNKEFVSFWKMSGKDEVIRAKFPISNHDLLEILKNRQAHCLKGVPLMDLSSIKGKRWFENLVVIWIFLLLQVHVMLYTVLISRLTNTPLN